MRWVLLGLGIAVPGVLVVIGVKLASFLDTDRDLSDFESPEQARAFTSAHLPAPLPTGAAVEKLYYARWTDWQFSARVRLPSSEAVDRYVEQVKRDRKLDDQRCGPSEPPDGARYFLPEVWACGSIERPSANVIELTCNTR